MIVGSALCLISLSMSEQEAAAVHRVLLEACKNIRVHSIRPGSQQPFMAAYQQIHPEKPTDKARLRVAIGLYELSQLAYFSRWQPELVPVYRERVGRWLKEVL